MFFFFNDTATTEIYTLSLHDALPISGDARLAPLVHMPDHHVVMRHLHAGMAFVEVHGDVIVPACQTGEVERSEEHTSELQSRQYLVCRLLLEKKKKLRYLNVSDATVS